ncbi:MAG: TPM domain-containing protein, partial [Thiotrichaceae bacterium]
RRRWWFIWRRRRIRRLVNMAFLTQQEKVEIADAIAKAETTNSGEIVAVLTKASDGYYYIPLMWAALFALLIPATINLFHIELFYGWQYESQLIAFVCMALLFHWRPIKLWLVPKYVQQQRCHRMAMQQFVEQNIHDTEARTGILFFVSVAEHYVEIIADEGINQTVDKATWENIVQLFTDKVKKSEVKEGFLQAIDECERILIEHIPAVKDNKNELSNQFVELK